MSLPLTRQRVDRYRPEFRTGIETEAATDAFAYRKPGKLVAHLVDVRPDVDTVIGAGNHTAGAAFAPGRVNFDVTLFLTVHVG